MRTSVYVSLPCCCGADRAREALWRNFPDGFLPPSQTTIMADPIRSWEAVLVECERGAGALEMSVRTDGEGGGSAGAGA